MANSLKANNACEHDVLFLYPNWFWWVSLSWGILSLINLSNICESVLEIEISRKLDKSFEDLVLFYLIIGTIWMILKFVGTMTQKLKMNL